MTGSPPIARKIFFTFLVVTGLAYLFYRILILFYVQPDAGGVEGNIIFFVQRLLNGDSLYTDPEHSPFAVAQYGPLYYYMVAAMAKMTGTGPDDVSCLYFISRLLSFLFAIGIAATLFLIARRRYALDKMFSIAVAIAGFIFLDITSFSRPDSAAIFLFLLALYLVLPGIAEERRYRSFYYAGIVCSLAILCKQNSIVLPLTLMVFLLLRNRIKECIYFLTPVVIVLLATTFLYFLSGELTIVYKNVIRGVSNGISPGWFRGAIVHDFYERIGFGLVILFILILIRTATEKRVEMKFMRFLLISTFVFANLFALKAGSHPGYFTEWICILFLTTAVSWETIKLTWVSVAAVSILLAAKFLSLEKPLRKMLVDSPPAVAKANYVQDKRLAILVQELTKGEAVFTNLYTPETFIACFLFRQAVVPQMDITGLTAYPRKTFNYDELLSSLDNGTIKWMLMRNSGPQRQFFEHSLNHFQLVYQAGTYNLYKYRP
jgi:hypothetical protein